MAWLHYPLMVGFFTGMMIVFGLCTWFPSLVVPLKILFGAFLAVVLYLQGYARGWRMGYSEGAWKRYARRHKP